MLIVSGFDSNVENLYMFVVCPPPPLLPLAYMKLAALVAALVVPAFLDVFLLVKSSTIVLRYHSLLLISAYICFTFSESSLMILRGIAYANIEELEEDSSLSLEYRD